MVEGCSELDKDQIREDLTYYGEKCRADSMGKGITHD